MPAPVDLQPDEADFEFASKTRTAEEIMADIESMEGGGDFKYTAHTTNYAPDGTEPKPAGENKAEPAPVPEPKISVPPVEPAKPAKAAGSETPAAASEPVAQPQEPEEHKRLGGWQRKIKAKDAEIGRLQKELEEARKGQVAKPAEPASKIPETPVAAPAAEPQAVDDPEPDPEKYADGVLDRQFLKDLQRWTIRDDRRQEEKAKQEREKTEAVRKLEADTRTAKTQLEVDQAKIEERWKAQLAEARKAHPDLDTVFNQGHPELVDQDGKLRPIANDQMWNTLRDMPDGAEVGYWLATHPDESAEIQELTALPPNASPSEVRDAYRTVIEEFADIRKELGKISRRAAKKAPPAAPPEAKPAEPVAAPVKANGAPQMAAPDLPAVAQPTKPPKKPLPEPITPIGTRGGGAYKSLRQLNTTSEGRQFIKDMDGREYRRRIDAGEGSEE